jgi:hypothetical protein
MSLWPASFRTTWAGKFNVVTFEAVKTTAVRLEVQCQERRSAGVYEWRLKTAP